MPDEEVPASVAPIKRGPGRPRKTPVNPPSGATPASASKPPSGPDVHDNKPPTPDESPPKGKEETKVAGDDATPKPKPKRDPKPKPAHTRKTVRVSNRAAGSSAGGASKHRANDGTGGDWLTPFLIILGGGAVLILLYLARKTQREGGGVPMETNEAPAESVAIPDHLRGQIASLNERGEIRLSNR